MKMKRKPNEMKYESLKRNSGESGAAPGGCAAQLLRRLALSRREENIEVIVKYYN